MLSEELVAYVVRLAERIRSVVAWPAGIVKTALTVLQTVAERRRHRRGRRPI